MSKRTDKELLRDILESIHRVELFVQAMDFEQFKNDIKTQDAVIRNIEIMGEAVKSLSPEVKQSQPDIPWRDISGTRDKLI